MPPAATIGVEDIEPQGEAAVQGEIRIEREALVGPRTVGEPHFVETLVGARHAGDGVNGAAVIAVAEEDGVGAARVVDALEIVAVVVDGEGEEVALRGRARAAAKRDLRRGSKDLRGAVVADIGDVDAPLAGLGHTLETKRVDKLARLHRIRHGRVFQITRQTPARERRRRDEAGIAPRGNHEGVHHHRIVRCGGFRRTGGNCLRDTPGAKASGQNERGDTA